MNFINIKSLCVVLTMMLGFSTLSTAQWQNTEDFEQGWGIWNDGGSDAYRLNQANLVNGNYSARLRDNSNAASSIFTDNLNLSGFNVVFISFQFLPESMETNEDFFLEYSANGGTNFETIRNYVVGRDFNNGERRHEQVTVNRNFTNTSVFRFRCDASGNSDFIYLDDVTISTTAAGACSVAVTTNNIQCNGNGTSTIDDDTFTVDVTVTGSNTSGRWVGGIAGQDRTGNIGQTLTFGPFRTNHGSTISGWFRDQNDSNCQMDITVTAPRGCSDQAPPPTTGCNGQITGFSINPQTTGLFNLNNGDSFCTDRFEASDIRIRANVSGTHQSLRFEIVTPNGTVTNNENAETYDSQQFWARNPGTYRITATLYSEDGQRGTICDTRTESFTIRDCGATACNTKSIRFRNTGPCPIALYDWRNDGDVFIATINAGAERTVNGTEGQRFRAIDTGRNFNNLVFDQEFTAGADCNQTFTINTDYCNQQPAACTGRITGFSINPQNAPFIGLTNGQNFCSDQFTARDIRIRANVTGAHQSLRFTISTPQGSWTTNENAETYDSKGFWATAAGTYRITAVLYSEDGQGGMQCDTRTETFTVRDCAPTCNVSGGRLTGGPYNFVVDGTPDFVSGITLSGNSGSNTAWVVTDDSGNILGLPPMPGVVDFDAAGPGVCYIYNVSYEAGFTGLTVGRNISNLGGCHDLSNFVVVNRVAAPAGCSGQITGFSINPKTAGLFNLNNGDSFCTDRFAASDIRIRANVSGTHQSLRFVIETPQGTWTTNENAETYDSKGFWATRAGTYRITATLYSEDGQRGMTCDTRTETFTIRDCAPTFDCPTLNANIGDSCNDGNNATTGDTVNGNCQCVGTCNTKSVRVRNTGPCPIALYDWRNNGDVFIAIINAGSERTVDATQNQRFRVIDTGRNFNNLVFDREFTIGADCSQTFTFNTDYCNQQPAGCNGQITGFSINPQNAAFINNFNGQEFCSTQFAARDIRIRANVSGTHQSMRFTITTPDGSWTTNENAETYDSKGFWATSPGTYTITAVLYSQDGQSGDQCDTRTERFTIRNCAAGGGNQGGGACSIVVATSNIQCSGNGTSSIHDDTFTVDVVVTGSNASARWTGGIGGQDITGNYGQRVTFGPFPTNSGSTISGWFTDQNDSNCLHDITVTPPRGCSEDTPTQGGCNFQLVSYEGFENGYGVWNDGGSDCARIEEDAAAAGRYCVRLRDNSGAASATLSDPLRLNGVNQVKVEFIFFASSMEAGEDFLLEYTNDGTNFTQVRSWVSGTDFENNRFINVNEIFGGNFTDNTRMRIRCDASSNYDFVFVDEVRISACGGAYLTSGSNTNRRSAETFTISLDKTEKVAEITETEISVYPNPASHTLNIKGLNGQSYEVFNITGQSVIKSSDKEALDLLPLQNGTYILRTTQGQMIRFNKI